ncbi:unnamed protein product, partial [Hapterophycus canaliculatus]
AQSGLLSELEDAGLTLSEAEKLLPALEESGVLTFAANNLDVLINLFGFIAIEPAKLAIPAVVSVVKALKGAGLLKLGNGDAAPVASKPVKATKAPKAMKFPGLKMKAAPEVKVAAPKKAKAKAAPKKAKAKAAPKAAAAAAKVKVVAPAKAKAKAALKAAAKPVAKAAKVMER